MSGPLLTILIPTFNRATFLCNLLQSLFKQLEMSGSSEVEILVANNQSTDHTAAMLDTLRKDRSYLRVHDQPSHYMSGEENIFEALPHCKSDYVWTVSDDDGLSDAAVEQVLGLVKRRAASFILLNTSLYSTGGKIRTFHYVSPSDFKTLVARGGYKFCEMIEALGFLGLLTNISSAVFLKNNIIKLDWRSFLEISPIYSHAAIYYAAFRDEPAIFLAEPLISVFDDEGLALDKITLVSGRSRKSRFYSWTVGLAKHVQNLRLDTARIIEVGPFGRAILGDLMIGYACSQIEAWLDGEDPVQALKVEDVHVLMSAATSTRHIFAWNRLLSLTMLLRPLAEPLSDFSRIVGRHVAILPANAYGEFRRAAISQAHDVIRELRDSLRANPPIRRTFPYGDYRISVVHGQWVAEHASIANEDAGAEILTEHFPHRLVGKAAEELMLRIEDIASLRSELPARAG